MNQLSNLIKSLETELEKLSIFEEVSLRISNNPSFDFHSNRGFMFGFANIASAFFSFSVLLVSLSLFTVGFIGMFVPFSPGVWLIMLGSIAFDLALFLRQPFVKVS